MGGWLGFVLRVGLILTLCLQRESKSRGINHLVSDVYY